MLDIMTKQSENEVYISGILNEMEVVEGVTADGREYIRATAKVRADQDIAGTVVESEIPVRFFSMRKKNDGTNNKIYDSILKMRDNFVSVAAAEDETEASRVTISAGRLEENVYVGQDGAVHEGFQVTTNFMNKAKASDVEKASYRVSGVVLNMKPEEVNDESTGRLIVTFAIVGYKGKLHKVDMIATDSAAKFIETNWTIGDTVQVTGRVNMSHKTIVTKEEQGFGEPIIRERTISNRELFITGGSPSGMEEALSYDADDIKVALSNRSKEIEEMRENSTKKNKPAKAKTDNFGF